MTTDLTRQMTRRLAVAPMMGWTHRHGRFFLRLLTKRVMLYSEMIAAEAVLHGNRERLLAFDPREKPLALQLGGSDPVMLAEAARIAEDWGYDEINLNMGCPSCRVAEEGGFGAALMRNPSRAARAFEAIAEAVGVAVSVKCRLGVDDDAPRETFPRFIEIMARAGCSLFIVHARKALLGGVSAKANRSVPPLDYGLVGEMKRANPDLTILLNGGIAELAQAEAHLETLDGVMIGRAVCRNPYMLSEADARFFGVVSDAPKSRADIFGLFRDYARGAFRDGHSPSLITRMAAGLFHGEAGARAFRRELMRMSFA